MIQPETIGSRRLELVPAAAETVRAILGGDLSAVAHAQGWPHDDTLDALPMAVAADPWAVWFVELDGVVIGECGTVGQIDEDGDVEIGYGLAAEYRGRGLGTELVAALSHWLLHRPGVRRVVARRVLADNVPSRRALERAGFVLERSEGGLVWYALAGGSA